MDDTNLTFVFVCQSGPLEAKAVLLAASVRRVSGDKYNLIAAVPQPESVFGTLSDVTLEALRSLDVKLEPITNLIDIEYLIGNKFDCLNVSSQSGGIAFLDSDIVMLRDIEAEEVSELTASKLAAVMASNTHCKPDEWREIYKIFDLECPPFNLKTIRSNESSPPYFNAGFIYRSADTDFVSCWVDTAKTIDASEGVAQRLKRPYLDQVSLPVSAERSKIEIRSLDMKWNFPSWARKIDPSAVPVFYHYQRASVLRNEKTVLSFSKEIYRNSGLVKKVLDRDDSFRMEFSPLYWLPNALLRSGKAVKAKIKSVLNIN